MIFGVQIKVKSGYQLVYDLKKSFFQVLKKWVLVDIILECLNQGEKVGASGCMT